MGIRAALGARPGDIVRLVAVGSVGWLIVGSMMEELLFGVDATDLHAFAGTSAVLLLLAALASYLPARRAAQVNPVEVLRRA